LQDDGPGKNRGQQKNREDGSGDGAGLRKQVADIGRG
jgi:hypothetical protein